MVVRTLSHLRQAKPLSQPRHVLLLVLSLFAPISMGLYLPLLPALTAGLGTAVSAAQMTLTACLVGIAVGHLVAGPLADQFGRRAPLLVGVAAYTGASVLCAIAPTVEILIVTRLVQGLAGGVGIVIAHAAGRDVYEGRALTRFYGQLTVIGGLAATVGPVVGGQLARVTDWRGVFGYLAVLGAVIFLASLLGFKESLPEGRRSDKGKARYGRDLRALMTHRGFVGAVLVCGFANAALFAYLAGATYVLQETYGLSPQGYSLAYAANSMGFMLFGYLGGRAAAVWSEQGTLAWSLLIAGLGAIVLMATGVFGLPLPIVLTGLFILAAGIAFGSPATTSLALAGHPAMAGTASALLGFARFGLGAAAAPLVGLADTAAVLPLGIVTASMILLAACAHVVLIRRPSRNLQTVGHASC